MRRPPRTGTASTAAIGLLLAAGLGVAAIAGHAAGGRVYSLAEVQAGLHNHAGAWLGRTLQVRGTIPLPLTFELCPTSGHACHDRGTAFLLYPDHTTVGPAGRLGSLEWDYEPLTNDALPIVPGQPDPTLAALRRLPLISSLLPRPQVPRFGTPAIYRLQLQPAPPGSMLCLAAPCYKAILLDAVSVEAG